MQRLLLAALAGGLMLFLWGAFFHMATPLHHAGWKPLASGGEQPFDKLVLEHMRTSSAEGGMYALPWKEGESEEEIMARGAVEGTAMLIYQPPVDWEAAMPKLLVKELLSNILVAFVAACLLACTPLRGFMPRAGFVAMLGLVSWLSIEVSYWNWFGFEWAYTSAALVDQVGGFFLVGLAIAKLTPALNRPAS